MCWCMCIHVCLCRVYVCVWYECVIGCTCEFMGECVLVAAPEFAHAIQTSNRRPGPYLNLCSQSADMRGDSKTDIRDGSEIRTDSCNEDQMATRAQNRVISCECLFLYFSLIYCCQ